MEEITQQIQGMFAGMQQERKTRRVRVDEALACAG